MAVKAVNNTASPNGLVPTLLVFGAYLRITERAIAIHKAITEINKLQARKLVNSALHYRNGPDTTLVYNLPINLEVLV
jgi:hypothetical protein